MKRISASVHNYLLFVFFLITGSISAQTTRNVPAQYSTIQSAANASVDGDTIKIASGVYYESVDAKSLSLVFVGSGPLDSTIIDGGQQAGFFNIKKSVVIRNFTIRNCLYGIFAEGPSITIIDCRLTNNTNGMLTTGSSEDRILNCLVDHNTTGYIRNDYGSDSYITNCTFADNAEDINFRASYTTATLQVFNSIITNAVTGTHANPVFLHYSNIVGMHTGGNVHLMQGCFDANPQFVDSSTNQYGLRSTSPCINAGDPNVICNDVDNSRNDMGFTGGTRIYLYPTDLDFEYVRSNSSRSSSFFIQNFSDKSITFSNATMSDAAITLDLSFPTTIQPGTIVTGTLHYSAGDTGLFSSSVKIYSSDLHGASYSEIPIRAHVLNYQNGIIRVPQNAPSIQVAVDIAKDGDTIMIAPGVYHESVNVYFLRLTFIGSPILDGTIIDGDQRNGLYYLHNYTLIKNLTFRNCDAAIIGYSEVISCHFINNKVGIQSSGGVNDKFVNCLFEHNVKAYSHVYYGVDCSMQNCTFSSNDVDIEFVPSYGTTAKLDVYNSIVRGVIYGTADNPVFLHYSNYVNSNLGTNVNVMEGCQQSDPQFIDINTSNYHLLSTSLCINAGSPETAGLGIPNIDLDGNPRVIKNIDIGAFEDQSIDTTKLWQMQLKASIGSYQDLENYAGVSDNATDGQDASFDVAEPPVSPGSYVSLFFPHPEWVSILGNNFANDIKKNTSLADTVKRLYFQVESNVLNDTVTLTFVKDRIPSAFGKYLTDLSSGKRVNLKTASFYKYCNTSETARSFMLTIGDTTAPSLALTSPNGGNIWRSGTLKTISWATSDGTGIDSVFVSFSPNNGESYWPISSLGPA